MKQEAKYGSKKHLNELLALSTSSLSDALNSIGIKGCMSHELKPLIAGIKMAGSVVTIKDLPTTKRVPITSALDAIDKAEPCSVFVRAVEGMDARNIALWGGLMSLAAKIKGIAGAVLDGGVRDTVEIKQMSFQIFSKSVSPSTSVGYTKVVATNSPVNCGGILVHPGDFIVGDDDGVVVIPRDKVEAVIEKAKRIDEVERKEAEELRKGRGLVGTVKKHARI
jgi:regulator of RNase E activity RraA